MTIEFNSDDDFPLNKTLGICSMIMVIRTAIHEENKYYSQLFLDACLYKL